MEIDYFFREFTNFYKGKKYTVLVAVSNNEVLFKISDVGKAMGCDSREKALRHHCTMVKFTDPNNNRSCYFTDAKGIDTLAKSTKNPIVWMIAYWLVVEVVGELQQSQLQRVAQELIQIAQSISK